MCIRDSFYPMVEAFGEKITCGIRINPEYSEVEVELYNPCACLLYTSRCV